MKFTTLNDDEDDGGRVTTRTGAGISVVVVIAYFVLYAAALPISLASCTARHRLRVRHSHLLLAEDHRPVT
jgi:hypothetical protein